MAFSFARRWKLRGADAMHLAAAQYLRQQLGESNTSIMLAASDDELLTAAQAMGFEIINPVLEESRAST